MRMKACDVCKKAIEGETLEIYLSETFKRFDVCSKCAEPVMKFLKTKKLIKPNNERKTKTRLVEERESA